MNIFFSVKPRLLWQTLVVVNLALGGCSTIPDNEQASTLTPKQLLQDSPLLTSELPLDSDPVDILALTPQMKAFIKQHVSDTHNDHSKLNQLLQVMLDKGLMGIDYEDITRSAAQTFETGSGNCLAFTNLFIALSRELDLKVRYQEVDVPPDWDLNADTFILVRHINAEVTLNRTERRAVDFNISNFKTRYPRRIISDQRARAHYYSNIAVEKMLNRDYQQALITIIQGIELAPDFAPLWTNLGALYMRHNLLDHAKASFIQALRIKADNYVALSNLEKINRRQGRLETAAKYERRVKVHRSKNPYYHYYLASNAFKANNYSDAVDHLKRAIKHKDDDHRFYFLMGLSHIRLNDQQRGKQFLQQAKKLADDVQSDVYQSKIDRLFSHLH